MSRELLNVTCALFACHGPQDAFDRLLSRLLSRFVDGSGSHFHTQGDHETRGAKYESWTSSPRSGS